MNIDEVQTQTEHDRAVLLITSALRVDGIVRIHLTGTNETAVLEDVSPDQATPAFEIRFSSCHSDRKGQVLEPIHGGPEAVLAFLRLCGYADVLMSLEKSL